jgi:hypothetical protein
VLARVIAFPVHRVRRRPSALVFASIADLDAQHRNATRLLALVVTIAGLLTGLGWLAFTI